MCLEVTLLAVWSVRALNLKVQFSFFFIKKNHKKGGDLDRTEKVCPY